MTYNYFYSISQVYQIFLIKLKAEIKESKILFFWFFLEPVAFILLFYLIFGSLRGFASEDFLSFLIIGKFCFLIFTKFLFSTARILRSYKVQIRSLDFYIFNYYSINSLTLMLKFSPLILLFIIYFLFNTHNLMKLSMVLIILISIILIAKFFGIIFSLIYVYFSSFDIILSILPLVLLFSSGVFFDLNNISNDLIRDILFLNPLAISINDMRIIFNTTQSFQLFIFIKYLIFNISSLILISFCFLYIDRSKKLKNQISLNLP